MIRFLPGSTERNYIRNDRWTGRHIPIMPDVWSYFSNSVICDNIVRCVGLIHSFINSHWDTEFDINKLLLDYHYITFCAAVSSTVFISPLWSHRGRERRKWKGRIHKLSSTFKRRPASSLSFNFFELPKSRFCQQYMKISISVGSFKWWSWWDKLARRGMGN